MDRVLGTLVHLRTGLTRQALAVLYGVGSPTIGRAIGEIRPLADPWICRIRAWPGIRLRTVEDVFAYAKSGVILQIDIHGDHFFCHFYARVVDIF
ncbi:transposase family protein [Streptomyces sp. NPDC001315]|uniref:transposase family protein n=1 Tax=Streptomyces sp. NPDC001315 TaxID=3364562 RepID=UPI003699F8EA